MEDTTLTLSLAVSIGVVLLTAIFLWLRHKQISKLRPRGGCAPVRVTPSGRLHLLLNKTRVNGLRLQEGYRTSAGYIFTFYDTMHEFLDSVV